MTEQEAINKLKYRIETASHIVGTGSENSFEDIEMAIAALEKQVQKKYERGLGKDEKYFEIAKERIKDVQLL